jgi:hypothetical protein
MEVIRLQWRERPRNKKSAKWQAEATNKSLEGDTDSRAAEAIFPICRTNLGTLTVRKSPSDSDWLLPESLDPVAQIEVDKMTPQAILGQRSRPHSLRKTWANCHRSPNINSATPWPGYSVPE